MVGVVLGNEVGVVLFDRDVIELVVGQSGLVNEQIGYLLGVQHCFSRVVGLVSASALHAVLDPVNSVGHSEPGVNDSFESRNCLEILVILGGVVEGAHRCENVAQALVLKDHILHGQAQLEVREKFDFVENCFKVFLVELIKQVGVLWIVSQILLEFATGSELGEVLGIYHLTLEHREGSVANSEDWEVLGFILVVLLSPFKSSPHCLSEGEIAELNKRFRVSWDVETVQL